jgi:hypothetical protein
LGIDIYDIYRVFNLDCRFADKYISHDDVSDLVSEARSDLEEIMGVNETELQVIERLNISFTSNIQSPINACKKLSGS